ncbi:hypothetical protein MRX96_005306 [Rhipicephalus microplus]
MRNTKDQGRRGKETGATDASAGRAHKSGADKELRGGIPPVSLRGEPKMGLLLPVNRLLRSPPLAGGPLVGAEFPLQLTGSKKEQPIELQAPYPLPILPPYRALNKSLRQSLPWFRRSETDVACKRINLPPNIRAKTVDSKRDVKADVYI